MGHQVIFRKKTSAIIPVTGDIPLNSLTIVDTSGASPSNVIDRFLVMFNKGDLPTGWILIVKYGTTEALTQYEDTNTWPDGSLKTAVVRCFIPSINANSTLQRNFWRRSSSYPNSNGFRSLSDISAHDFKITFTDVRDETGTLVAASETLAANTNLNNALYTKKIAQGPNCDAWETWIKSANGHMQVKWNFEVWTDPTNTANVYAISHAPWVRAGWRNVASPHSYTFKMEYFDGVTSLKNFAVTHSIVPGDIDTVNDLIANTNIESGRCLFLTSGTLPGISSGTPYFAKRDGAGNISLHPCANDVWAGGFDKQNITGTGTCTLTEYEALTYHTGLFVRGGNASEKWKEWWTANEPRLEVAWTASERLYLRKAGFIWPFRAAANPSPPTTCDYYPGSLCWPSGGAAGQIIADWDGTGDASGVLYCWPQDVCGAFQSMNLTALRVAKVFSYCGAHLPLTWLDETTSGGVEVNSPLTLDNGPDNAGALYSGMGTPRATSDTFNSWSGIGTSNNISGGRIAHGPATISTDHSHFQYSAFPGYILTADPQLRELMYFSANAAIWPWQNNAGNDRSKAYQGTQYYGIFCHWQQQRCEGYQARDFIDAYVAAPDGSGIKSYLGNCITRSLAYYIAWRGHENSNFSNGGQWVPYDNAWGAGTHFSACNYLGVGGFQAYWQAIGFMRLDRLFRTTNSSTMAQHFALFAKLMVTTFQSGSGYWANAYGINPKAAVAVADWLTAANWGLGPGDGSGAQFQASNVVHDTSPTNFANTLHVAAGDFVQFDNRADVGAPPPEITLGAQYKLISFSGGAQTYKLNPSPYDGTTVLNFTSQAGLAECSYHVAQDSATGFGWPNEQYAQLVTCVLYMAKAYGYTALSPDTPIANLEQRLIDMSWSLQDDQRFDFDKTVL